jgi:hydroxyacylglutathione hydrolase
MIGLDRVRGVLGAESIAEWGRMAPLTTVRQTTPREAAESIGRGEAVLVDVRGRAEWEAAHPAGATNIPLGHLVDRRDELPRHRSIIVQCGTGARSAIAASVLERLGITRVANLVGGMAAWERAGLDVEGPDARRAGAPALAVA